MQNIFFSTIQAVEPGTPPDKDGLYGGRKKKNLQKRDKSFSDFKCNAQQYPFI